MKRAGALLAAKILGIDDMQFIGSFSTFDPLQGYFDRPYSELGVSRIGIDDNSISYPPILDWIAGRAQKIVAARSRKEIEYALDIVNYLLSLAESSNGPEFYSDDLLETVAHEMANSRSIERFTPGRLLASQISQFRIDEDDLFPNGKWEELFAILALAALGDIHRFSIEEEQLSSVALELAAEAMESLAFAEARTMFPELLNQGLREKISTRNRRNAITGHAALNVWKSRFCDWVFDTHIPSLGGRKLVMRAAARKFKQETMDPALRAGETPELEGQEDLVRTLAEALAKDRRLSDF